MFSPRFALRLLALLHTAFARAGSSAAAVRPLAAALLVRAGAGFRVTAREPAPAGETPWDEAEGRRLAAGSCDEWCDDSAAVEQLQFAQEWRVLSDRELR